MNTHKEELKFKVRDWVVVKGYRDGEIGYVDKVDQTEKVPYTVAFPSPTGGSSFYEEGNLAPLEPKEEKEYQEYKEAEEKRIYDIEHDYVRPKEPTPPSQIEEESLRTLVEKWREYTNRRTNEGFPMPVDNSFRGFMEWLEGEVR